MADPTASAPATAPAPDGLPLPQRYLAVVTIVLGISLSVLDSTIVNLALPTIARDLNVSAAQVVWVVNAYQVAILGLMLPLAMLGDGIGYRRVYLAGVVLFTVASLGCTLARSLPALALARIAQGVGGAAMFSVNAALVRLTYPRDRLGRGVALNSVVVAAASVAGPALAGAMLSVVTWPWLFGVNLPLGVVVLVLGLRALPANRAPAPAGWRWPIVDVALNIATCALLFLGANALGARPGTAQALSRGVALGLLAAGLVLGVLYVRRQRREAVPLLPVDLLRIRVFRLSMCTSIGAFAAQMLGSIALPFLLLEGLGRSHGEAGLVLAVWPLAVVAAAPVAGRLIGRVADGLLGGIGLATLALGLGALALLPAAPATADIAWRLALCGIGFGLFQSPNNHTIVTSAPVQRAGAASGMLGSARLAGQSLAALAVGLLFGVLHAGDRGPVAALALGSACAAAAGVFSLLRLRG